MPKRKGSRRRASVANKSENTSGNEIVSPPLAKRPKRAPVTEGSTKYKGKSNATVNEEPEELVENAIPSPPVSDRPKRSTAPKGLAVKKEDVGEKPMEQENGKGAKEEKIKAVRLKNAKTEMFLLTEATHLHPPNDGAATEYSKIELKMENYQVYDEDGYLVPLDIETKKKIRVSGVALHWTAEPGKENGEGSVPVADIAIDYPYLCGFGKEDELTFVISTDRFEFYLLDPHENYAPLYDDFKQKSELTKATIDFFIDNVAAPYLTDDELTQHFEEKSHLGSHISMENLMAHSKFVLRYLIDYDEARDEDEPSILDNKCADWLKKLNPDKKGKRGRCTARKEAKGPLLHTAVPLTPIVKKIFPEFVEGNTTALRDGPMKKKGGKKAKKSKPDVKEKILKVEIVTPTSVEYQGQVYHIGDGVYLPNTAFEIKSSRKATAEKDDYEYKDYDKEKYPELYRKYIHNEIDKTQPKPFCIGCITGFGKLDKRGDFETTVRVFCQAEDTSLDLPVARSKDVNLLYLTKKTLKISFSMVQGRCLIFSKDDILKKMSLEEYYSTGRDRFYFEEEYIEDTGRFKKISSFPEGNIALKRIETLLKETSHSKVERPLRTLDLFCGVGGLSEGFHQSGVAVTKWAVEINNDAADGFKLNNPDAIVYKEDCNILLKEALENPEKSKLPKPGEVELIIGGPPCQGFSALNRHPGGKAANWKNSLVATYLCFVEHYLPRFVVMENVRNFTSDYEDSFYCRALECFRELGYTAEGAVLQAGHYGVPQNRRRTIIIAAKEGEIMPNFPAPTHSFVSKFATTNADGGAPFRSMTVADGISDLGEARLESSDNTMPYRLDPQTHYQRMLRKDSTKLVDHVVKKLPTINQERINRIPPRPDADWRNLPNIKIPELNVVKLVYNKKTKKVGPKPLNKETMIPWCLPNTADKHNHWAGLFGRLDNEGVFPTVVTHPYPMGKQGRVLHPTENRLISVREAARSQGFPDDFKFSGGIPSRYCQIGNAVPPPLAAAIGRELARAVVEKEGEYEAEY